ncbi:MAG TPA: hypothetical protein V6C78_15995 [Crinalium sp.]|jgi:hypothetical protein
MKTSSGKTTGWLRGGLASLSLCATLGGIGTIWLMTETLVPQVAQAEPARMLIPLNREPGETYDTLIRRAEATSRVLTQRSFDNNPAVTDVSITVTAEREGLIAPLLTLEASRDQWRSRPEPQYWTTYFETSRALLGLDGTAGGETLPTTAGSPAATTQPVQPVQPMGPQAQRQQPAANQGPGASGNTPPVQINLPAAPAGQLGLPRSVLP